MRENLTQLKKPNESALLNDEERNYNKYDSKY